MIRQDYFNTLNEALAAETLIERWPLGTNISYCETVSIKQDDYFISVYRNENGLYERPIHYKLKPSAYVDGSLIIHRRKN